MKWCINRKTSLVNKGYVIVLMSVKRRQKIQLQEAYFCSYGKQGWGSEGL